jgi:hypothetical protein
MLQAIVAMIPVGFGCIYFLMAGAQAERYARSFAALPPLIYLLAVFGTRKTDEAD